MKVKLIKQWAVKHDIIILNGEVEVSPHRAAQLAAAGVIDPVKVNVKKERKKNKEAAMRKDSKFFEKESED